MKIATLQLLIVVLLCSCANKPKTHTAVPSLDTAKVQTEYVQKGIDRARATNARAMTLNERMDYKASLLEGGPDTTQKFDKEGNPNFGPRR